MFESKLLINVPPLLLSSSPPLLLSSSMDIPLGFWRSHSPSRKHSSHSSAIDFKMKKRRRGREEEGRGERERGGRKERERGEGERRESWPLSEGSELGSTLWGVPLPHANEVSQLLYNNEIEKGRKSRKEDEERREGELKEYCLVIQKPWRVQVISVTNLVPYYKIIKRKRKEDRKEI